MLSVKLIYTKLLLQFTRSSLNGQYIPGQRGEFAGPGVCPAGYVTLPLRKRRPFSDIEYPHGPPAIREIFRQNIENTDTAVTYIGRNRDEL